jgi:hypothetical protein
MRLLQGAAITGLQSFVNLQAPTLARPPGRTHRSNWLLGGQAVYTTHRPAGYPNRDVVSLRARHGQLTRLDLHQLDCSLVGCSFPHRAPHCCSLPDKRWITRRQAGPVARPVPDKRRPRLT